MAFVLLAFPDAPSEFRRGLIRIMGDEQRHTRLHVERAAELGIQFGELPVNGYIWAKAQQFESLLDYLAGLPLTFEGCNLDHTLELEQSFQRRGRAKRGHPAGHPPRRDRARPLRHRMAAAAQAGRPDRLGRLRRPPPLAAPCGKGRGRRLSPRSAIASRNDARVHRAPGGLSRTSPSSRLGNLSMTARIIDGKAIAEKIRGEIAAQVAEFRRQTDCVPHLAAILVGDDPASGVYVRGKQRACEKAGLKSTLHRLPDTTSEDDLLALVAPVQSQLRRPRHPGAVAAAQADQSAARPRHGFAAQGRRRVPSGERRPDRPGASPFSALHAARSAAAVD